MAYEFELESKLETIKQQTNNNMEGMREDRRDRRVDMQAMHQKQMIDQKSKDNSLKNFESSGNDILTGGASIDRFAP